MTRAMVLAQTLLACLESELTDPDYPYPLPPERVQLRSGEEFRAMLSKNADECCPGIAWVRIAGISGRRQDTTDPLIRCFGNERILTLEMGVIRCMPTPGAGDLVTEAQWTDVALKTDADLGAMEAALCCLASAEDIDDASAFQAYEPIGPDGNCVGGRLTVNIAMEACC